MCSVVAMCAIHRNLSVAAGLFPLFGHAAMNVRPALLTIYETHFVPLGRRLRPGLRGFLSGILPGLDEGSDYFDRSVSQAALSAVTSLTCCASFTTVVSLLAQTA